MIHYMGLRFMNSCLPFVAIAAILLLTPFATGGSPVPINPDYTVYKHIVRLRPKINKYYALQLATLIDHYATVYKVNPRISVAIAMQESSLRDINRYTYVLHKNRWVYAATDLGVFQLHISTLKYFGIRSTNRTLEWQVKAHMIILKKKMHRCKDKPYSWACYHSATPSKRRDYAKRVMRWM